MRGIAMWAWWVIGVVVLCGCAVVEPAVMKDPESGAVVQCTSNTAGGFFPIVNGWTAQHEIDACAAGYERAGWKRQ